MPESAPRSRVAWAVLAIELILAVVVIALVGVPLLAESSSAPRFHQAAPTPTPQSVVIGGPTMTPTPRVITTPPPEAP